MQMNECAELGQLMLDNLNKKNIPVMMLGAFTSSLALITYAQARARDLDLVEVSLEIF